MPVYVLVREEHDFYTDEYPATVVGVYTTRTLAETMRASLLAAWGTSYTIEEFDLTTEMDW